MDHFAGLDVSVKATSICIVDDTGRIVREVKVASEPEALLKVLGNPTYRFKRIGLEAGPLSQWLFRALAELIEWTPQPSDFLKHDDEKRTYDDVFGAYRDEQANYSTCVFPRVAFSRPYEAESVLLKLKDGMRLLDLGCGSGAAAYYLASRRDIEIVCVTNSSVQADICRRKFAKLGGRGQVIVTDFDSLDLPSESFDSIYALESIGYTKNLDAWLARCWRMLKPGGSLLIRSPGSLDHCRRKEDYLSVTVFFDNWRYNFVGANLLVYKMRRLGFNPMRYRRRPAEARYHPVHRRQRLAARPGPAMAPSIPPRRACGRSPRRWPRNTVLRGFTSATSSSMVPSTATKSADAFWTPTRAATGCSISRASSRMLRRALSGNDVRLS